jgi:hypothetical protein
MNRRFKMSYETKKLIEETGDYNAYKINSIKEDLKKEIDDLKNKMKEIKEILNKLINK